ncbi:hypothetical protein GLA29479_738 [Lysobacter antibioticus]|uniref:Uncharacterized protein n=1 Tax=Lysobacter antibioticus TaxID=84531 RepID=A0A0S2DSY0_LYSAN|nr:hypothetical protein GLA29479_738 [Lysobacter antibioticus]ALN79694.1 hypothetical protein LA76x_1538 [Lysobacter antibioticus]
MKSRHDPSDRGWTSAGTDGPTVRSGMVNTRRAAPYGDEL